MRRILVSALLLLAVLGLASQQARANEITVAGATSASLLPTGISFLPGSFSATTSGGFAGLSNLGSYVLATTPATYSGVVDLIVTFTVPTGINGGGSATFAANLMGNVSTNASGGINISFTNPTQTFTFSNASGSGSFTLTVNPVSVSPGGSTAVSGFISGGVFTPTPEPSSIALLGAGLLVASLGFKKLR